MQPMSLFNTLNTMLVAQQGSLELYRSAAMRAESSSVKDLCQNLAQDAEKHRQLLAKTIQEIGGDPNFVGPSARLGQFKSMQLLESHRLFDGLARSVVEQSDVETILSTVQNGVMHWELLAALGSQGQTSGPTSKSSEKSQKDIGQMCQRISEVANSVLPQEQQTLERVRQSLKQLAEQSLMNDSATANSEVSGRITAPEPSIEQIHPAPVMSGLQEQAKQPMWQESTVTRAMKAQ